MQNGMRTMRSGVERLEDRLALTSTAGWDGPGQGTADLTYYIGDVPSYLDESEVHEALEFALGVWAEVVDVEFTETSRPRQRDSIDLYFDRIDGKGGALAEAYFPDDVNPRRLAGDVTFDSAERWEIGNDQGVYAVDLVLVAVHELGHALGLEHPDVSGSVMLEGVTYRQAFVGLASVDVASALALYAPASVHSIRGDFNGDGVVGAEDVDLLAQQVQNNVEDSAFDLDSDGIVDSLDRDVMIEDVLGTSYGDVNLDGRFDQTDIILVMQRAHYLDGSPSNATWATGDWNGDREFDALDIVLALQDGGWTG